LHYSTAAQKRKAKGPNKNVKSCNSFYVDTSWCRHNYHLYLVLTQSAIVKSANTNVATEQETKKKQRKRKQTKRIEFTSCQAIS